MKTIEQAKFNMQQQSKVWGYLSCLEARPGHVLLQEDFNSVEPTVLAEFSKCPNYRKLYGPDANPNHDVYMFVGARFSAFRDKFLEYYDLDDPTAELIKKAKKLYKLERSICKESHLAMQYGAGPPTVHGALVRKEIDIELDEVIEMHRAYWSTDLFAAVKEFEAKLKRQWQRNNGWIANGLGVPRALSEDKLKDSLSRFCQSTGHDLLQRQLRLVNRERKKEGVRMWPWIPDYHDEMIWECVEQDKEAGLEILRSTLAEMNESLPWEIKIKGEPTVAQNLAQIKCVD